MKFFKKMSMLKIILFGVLSLEVPVQAAETLSNKTSLNDLQGDIRDDHYGLKQMRNNLQAAHAGVLGYYKEDVKGDEGNRDMGDVLHYLGHNAETNKQYDLAIRYHRLSIGHFKRTKWESNTSPDGVLHGLEHLFQSLFDAGELAFAKNEFVKAKEYFIQAEELYKDHRLDKVFLEQKHIDGWSTNGSLRVKLRYPHLLAYMKHLDKELMSCKFVLRSRKSF